jgi:hypothetical protein
MAGWPRTFIPLLLLVAGAAVVVAEEPVFRLDGQLGRDGRQQMNITVQDGQQLAFRLASLDFVPKFRVSLNGQEFTAESDGVSLASRFIHVRKPGTAVVSIDAPPTASSASFQFRVLRVRDNPPLVRQSVQRGSITSQDQREGKGRYVDWYPLAVTKGQRLIIGVSSRAADAALRVELPDGTNLDNDDAVGTDARLAFEVGESGTAWVGAAVLVRDEVFRDDAGIPYQVYVRDHQSVSRPLVLGQVGQATPFQLVGDDLPPLPEAYHFLAPRAGVYRFRLEGRDGAQPLLSGRLDTDRAFAGAADRNQRDSTQIRCFLRNGQRIELAADSLPGGWRPQYLISVAYDGPGIQLREGDSLERSISDPRQGFFVYHGKAGEYAEFQMSSDDFETRLVVTDPGGQLFTWSKYYGSEFSYASQGGYWFDQAGDLVLETGSRNAGDYGVFRITARSSLSESLALPKEAVGRPALVSGSPVYARITDRHAPAKGGFADEYSMDLRAADLLAVRLQSWDLEARLEILGPDGALLLGPAYQSGKDNTCELPVPRGGRYLFRVLVPAAEGKALNATYTLSPEVLGSLQPLDPDLTARETDLVAPPDRPAADPPWIDLPLKLRSAQHVYLAVDAPDFQPVLKLLDKDGTVIDENHGIGRRGSARIDSTILKGGTYRLRILRGAPLAAGAPAGLHCTVNAYELR